MKGKKAVVIVIIAAVLAVGWFLSVKKASGVDQRNTQNALVEEADLYAGKRLYIRAIPLYREALGYSTQSNTEIEKKLLAAYLEHGDMEEYVDLVERRVEVGTAEEAEYITAADHYITRRDRETAMKLVRTGIEQTGSQRLQTYYEENRYTSNVVITDYETITPTVNNSVMPAFDGEHWIYVDGNGRDTGIGVFDSATPFNADGYAAVSLGNQYYTVLTDGEWYGADSLGVSDVYGVSGSRVLACYNGKYGYYDYDFESLTGSSHQYDAITGNHNGVAAVKAGDKWRIIEDSGESVTDFVLDDVAVNSLGEAYAGGAAMVRTGGAWHLIDTEGNQVLEAGFPDARAPESDNGYIAVANDMGKWGFIDRGGTLMIEYQYDDAKSFSNGIGAVLLGNTWTYISEKNKAILDIGFQDAQPFHNGIAQAKTTDGAALITLDYFEG